MFDPVRNETDDLFIQELNQHISNEPISTLIQEYLKDLVHDSIDYITDTDWFTDQIYKAVKDREDEDESN